MTSHLERTRLRLRWSSRAMFAIILVIVIEHLVLLIDATPRTANLPSQPSQHRKQYFSIDNTEDDFLERLLAESTFLSENHRLSGSNKHLSANSDAIDNAENQFASFKKPNHNKPTTTTAPASLSIASFIEKVTDMNTCRPELMQYETQAKLKSLQSVISTCSDYCRLAISPENQIYGSRSFHLETIWQKIAEESSKIIENNALIGAYYMKFVVSGKYLCINKKGDLFSSSNATKACLWFTSSNKIISAYYSFHLVLTSACQVKTVSSSVQAANHQGKNLLRSIISGRFNPQEAAQLSDSTSCNQILNVTSGFAPDLKKYIKNCQTSLLKQSYRIPSNDKSPSDTNSQFNKAGVFTLTSTASSPIVKTTVKTVDGFDGERLAVTIAKTTPLPADFGSRRLDKLCRKYLKANAMENSAISLPEAKFNAYSYELMGEGSNKIPEKCVEYLEKHSELSRKKELSSQEQQFLENEYLANRVVELLFESPSTNHNDNKNQHKPTIMTTPSKSVHLVTHAPTDLPTTTTPNKFKKCYALRNKPGYKECMNKYYKCFNPNFTAEELRKCRERNGITPAPRLNLVY